MTAGRGIQHSEVSTTAADALHGVQLWTALPDAARGGAHFFEHHVADIVRVGDATLRVFVGSWLGVTSPVTAYTPLVAAQLDLPPGASVVLPADTAFEYGLVVDHEPARLQGVDVPAHHLGVIPTGSDVLRIEAIAGALRVLVIGGAPFGEPIVMWWNFVGRSHPDVDRGVRAMYGRAGPGTRVNRSVRNAMSPTQDDPSYSSGRVPAGSSGATVSDGTCQCRKLTGRPVLRQDHASDQRGRDGLDGFHPVTVDARCASA